MGCSSSNLSADVGRPKQKGSADAFPADEEVDELPDEAPADLPEPGYPTLLEASHRFEHEDVFDTASDASSRPTTSVSIPTPSIPASQSTLNHNSTVRADLESLVSIGNNSTVRAEWDKDRSADEVSALRGTTSVAGTTLGRPEDIESIVGSIAESRAESHTIFNYRSASGGAPSVCGGCSSAGVAERDRDADLDSMYGSITESRADSQFNYLHDMDSARSPAENYLHHSHDSTHRSNGGLPGASGPSGRPRASSGPSREQDGGHFSPFIFLDTGRPSRPSASSAQEQQLVSM